MAMKARTATSFVMFDVVYEDGSRSSNRKVLASVLNGLDGDEPARRHRRSPGQGHRDGLGARQKRRQIDCPFARAVRRRELRGGPESARRQSIAVVTA